MSSVNKADPGPVWDFDEQGYLAANPDVREAVAAGDLASGLDHFYRWGWQEHRPGVTAAAVPLSAESRRQLRPPPE